MWNFNLPDSDYGSLVLSINQGSIASEMKSYGLNVSFRRNNNNSNASTAPQHLQQDNTDTNKKRQSVVIF